MPKYRKKPVVIEARQLTADNYQEIATWCDGTARPPAPSGTFYGGAVSIETLEGTLCADVGDWVIRGVKGEFYPVKPDIFKATYEPVE